MTSKKKTARMIARELYDRQQRQLEEAGLRIQALESENSGLESENSDLEAKVSVLENEVGLLLKRISELRTEIARATGRPEQMALELELKVLQERLADHQTDAFATSKSERRGKGNGSRPREKSSGQPEQKPLPVEEVLHEKSVEDLDCAKCGGDLKEIEGKTTDHDVIVVVRRSYKIIRHRSKHYRCKGCSRCKVAEGPRGLLRKNGRYDLSVAAQVATDKYMNHMPLERQVRQMRRDGLKVASQTLWDQIKSLAMLLLPVWEGLRDETLASEYVHMDLTPWRLMKNKGGSKWWQMACIATTAAAWFKIGPRKSKLVVAALLKSYEGIVVSDGDPAIKALARARSRNLQLPLWERPEEIPDYKSAGCWAHARRRFVKAEKHGEAVGFLLDKIALLYQIETEAAQIAELTGRSMAEVRSRLRRTKSAMVTGTIRKWLDVQKPSKKTNFYEGVQYLENQWESLTLFLTEPAIPLDNNYVERLLRDAVLGRKNHQGSRSQDGLYVAGVFYSICGTCTLLGLDPQDYIMAAAKAAMDGRRLMPKEFLTSSAT